MQVVQIRSSSKSRHRTVGFDSRPSCVREPALAFSSSHEQDRQRETGCLKRSQLVAHLARGQTNGKASQDEAGFRASWPIDALRRCSGCLCRFIACPWIALVSCSNCTHGLQGSIPPGSGCNTDLGDMFQGCQPPPPAVSAFKTPDGCFVKSVWPGRSIAYSSYRGRALFQRLQTPREGHLEPPVDDHKLVMMSCTSRAS